MELLDDKIREYFNKYKVSTDDKTSKEYFMAAVNIALKEYDLPIKDVAAKFQVADSTVLRWANGVANPHPRMRELILEYVAKHI